MARRWNREFIQLDRDVSGGASSIVIDLFSASWRTPYVRSPWSSAVGHGPAAGR